MYDFANTDFVSSQLGSIIQTFTYFFLNIFCTLIVGITLNIVSFVQYKAYLSDKKRFINSGIQQQNAQSETITLSKLRKSEKSMLFMIITLCSISIVSRIVFILCAMYFVFYSGNTFANSLVVRVVCYSIYSFVPIVATCIFYAFNKIFRKEYRRLILTQISFNRN